MCSTELEEMHVGVASAFALTGYHPCVGATYHGLASTADAHVEVIARASGKPGRVVVTVDDDGAAE